MSTVQTYKMYFKNPKIGAMLSQCARCHVGLIDSNTFGLNMLNSESVEILHTNSCYLMIY